MRRPLTKGLARPVGGRIHAREGSDRSSAPGPRHARRCGCDLCAAGTRTVHGGRGDGRGGMGFLRGVLAGVLIALLAAGGLALLIPPEGPTVVAPGASPAASNPPTAPVQDAVPSVGPDADTEPAGARPAPGPAAPATPPPPPGAVVPANAPGIPAWRRYGSSAQAAPGKALFAIVLDMSVEGAAGPEAVATLGLPVSLALPPALAGSVERLRAAGYEVLVRPPTLDASALAAALKVLPEAVALFEPTGTLGLGAGRAQAAVADLTAQGIGLAAWSGTGDDALARAASAAGLPHRSIDEKIEGTADIARMGAALDAAALSAAAKGGVLVTAPGTPAMFQALAAWALSRNNREVSLVPLTALWRTLP